MSLQAIPNQPVIFDEPDGACLLATVEYAQIVSYGDNTQFQLKNAPCASSIPLIENGGFDDASAWSFGTGWVSGAGYVEHTVGGGFGLLEQSVAFAAGRYYQLEITVDLINVQPESNGFAVTDGSEVLGYMQSGSQTFTFWFFAVGSTMTVVPTNTNDYIKITSIQAYELTSNIGINIIDANGIGGYAYFNNTTNPERFTWYKDTVTILIPWDDVTGSDGCYRICVMDGCINTCAQNGVPNGDFAEGLNYWEPTTEDNITYGETPGTPSLFIGPTAAAAFQLVLEHTLVEICEDISIVVSFNVLEIKNAAGITVTVDAGNKQLDITSPVVGTNTLSFTAGNTPTVNGPLILTIDGGSTSNIAITDFTVTYFDAGENFTCNLTSNLFNYKDWSNECTVFISISSTDDAFGFRFGDSNFAPRLRFGGRLAPHTEPYINVRRTIQQSNGEKYPVYFESRKQMVLAFFNEIPEIYDFVRLAIGAQHFYINGVEYFVEQDEFEEITWNRDRSLGKATLLCGKRTQTVEYVQTSTDRGGINPVAGILLLSGDISSFVLQSEDQTTIELSTNQ